MGSLSDFPFKIGVLAVTIFLLASHVDGKAREPKDKKCEKGFNLLNDKPPTKFQLRFPLKAPKCYWGVYGSTTCKPELSCTIDMPKGDEDYCSENYVMVTDGSAGSKTFCGKSEFNRIRASDGLRHIFLVVSYTDTTAATGVFCTAQCAKDDSGEKLVKTMEKKIENGCVCGLQNKDDRIVGGEDAKANEFPWQAAVVYPKTRSPNCGASVINDRFVLTAAHCFALPDDLKTAEQIEVLTHAHLLDMTKKSNAKDVALGRDGSIRSSGYKAQKRTDEDEGSTRYKVLEIINHPLFTEFYDFDYALLRLDKKIKLADADAPTPICLPSPTIFDAEMADWVGKNLTVTGWGLASENAGGTTRMLQKLDVPYMDFSKCKQMASDPKVVTNRMICAGYENGEKDACTGDSGGPLIKKDPASKQFRQVGIVSWGEGCARAGKPGYYSRITEMMQWIDLHTMDQNAVWCHPTK